MFTNELEAGTVFLNRCDFLDPALAWTGVKNSGRGVSLSTFGGFILCDSSPVDSAHLTNEKENPQAMTS